MRTVVMYHYVRDAAKTEYPGLYTRTIDQFEFQLDYLEANFKVSALPGLDDSNEPTAILTFDDGIKDHYTNAFPILQRQNLPATFYVSSLPLQKPVVLDVHKIQLLLGSQSHDKLFELLISELGAQRLREYEESGTISSDTARFDDQKTILFKRLLQRDLELPLRSEILGKIFNHFYPGAEEKISKDFYMSIPELREMKAGGMTIGNHTVNHHWLGHLNIEEAKREISECEELLIEEGLMDESFKTVSYPYGNSSELVEQFAADSNYAYAFTTVAEHWNPKAFDAMKVPRLDTNDVPFQ